MKSNNRLSSALNGKQTVEARRALLEKYRVLASRGDISNRKTLSQVREALSYLGGQSSRTPTSLRDYDHLTFGPFLGISDEGAAAPAITRAAAASAKGLALGRKRSPLTLGVALDGERLGGVGEVPVGPREFADIWIDCIGRTMMTTNVGSRVNLRFFRRPPVVLVGTGRKATVLAQAKKDLEAAFAPFLLAIGGPRPLTVFLEFASAAAGQPALLAQLQKYVAQSGIADPRIHRLGLNVKIDWGAKGRLTAERAIAVAHASGLTEVSIDGVARKEAGPVVSLPGLLNFLPPDEVEVLLAFGRARKIAVHPLDQVDCDTVAREIWATLNTARAMGTDLGKYGLFPLTLEECDQVIGLIQSWFPDWSAAPVFYVDQGILGRERVYSGGQLVAGVKAWLDVLHKHAVRVCLIDTVDKSRGWRILREGSDTAGILTRKQILELNDYARKRRINVLWAGGIKLEQAYQFGELGVFGIYVTTAASKASAVIGDYKRDPALAESKRPTYNGVLTVKSMLEAGFLTARLPQVGGRLRPQAQKLHADLTAAKGNPTELHHILPAAWTCWWQARRAR